MHDYQMNAMEWIAVDAHKVGGWWLNNNVFININIISYIVWDLMLNANM